MFPKTFEPLRFCCKHKQKIIQIMQEKKAKCLPAPSFSCNVFEGDLCPFLVSCVFNPLELGLDIVLIVCCRITCWPSGKLEIITKSWLFQTNTNWNENYCTITRFKVSQHYILEESKFNSRYVKLCDLDIPREKWLNYLQTVENLIRCYTAQCRVWVCIVCQLSSRGLQTKMG